MVASFTKEGDFASQEKNKGKFYPALGELRNLYNDWEIVDYSEENSRAKATKPDGSPMFNIAAQVLARKLRE